MGSRTVPLIQLVTHRAYVIDFVACGTGAEAETLIRELLESESVKKLTYAFRTDLSMLHTTFPLSVTVGVCVCDLRDALSGPRRGGLSALVEYLFGRGLDKALQVCCFQQSIEIVYGTDSLHWKQRV